MGSWSVYCGISNISITAGHKCVFLPLKKNSSGEYLPYIPATLPIFGEYDDYGGMKNIEHDENTKLIEDHFKCTIEEFCHFFCRGIISNDEDDFPKFLKKVPELTKWEFMFIDRNVYDFMSTHAHKGYGGQGDLDFGRPEILELLGFTPVGKDDAEKRYKNVWEYQGVKFYSDGEWLHYKNEKNQEQAIYNFSDFAQYVKLPEDKLWIGEKTMWQLWEHLHRRQQCEQLFWIIGKDRTTALDEEMDEMVGRGKRISKTLADKYVTEENLPKFGNGLCELVTIRRNLHCMSGYFEPHILYLTPQCGEFGQHQLLLEKFTEINKGYVEPDEDEE